MLDIVQSLPPIVPPRLGHVSPVDEQEEREPQEQSQHGPRLHPAGLPAVTTTLETLHHCNVVSMFHEDDIRVNEQGR